MKRQLQHMFLFIAFCITLASCDKENISEQFNPFYKLTVNGNKKAIDACGTSDFVASYLKDTAVFAAFGCGGQRAGFYLKGQIIDGTYLLNDMNKAWFDDGAYSYSTDNLNGGTLTIKRGNFQAIGGLIPFVEGTFSFDAKEINTGKIIKVTSGKYLLKKFQY